MSYKCILRAALIGVISVTSCSEDAQEPVTPPGNIPPGKQVSCVVEEIEFRNGRDQIVAIREFTYNIRYGNRMETISIVEDTGTDVLNLRFQLKYRDELSLIPFQMDEVFGSNIISSIEFHFDPSGNLSEFTQYKLFDASIPPESHVFIYEPSTLADDSINSRIITFDIERLTQNWIDVLPALFTNGGQRITRFDRISFRGDLLEFCDFHYDENGFLEEIQCRSSDGILTEMWNFSYNKNRLVSAFHQLPNFRDLAEYEYGSDGKPLFVVSTTDGRFNWKGRYFYLCR